MSVCIVPMPCVCVCVHAYTSHTFYIYWQALSDSTYCIYQRYCSMDNRVTVYTTYCIYIYTIQYTLTVYTYCICIQYNGRILMPHIVFGSVDRLVHGIV